MTTPVSKTWGTGLDEPDHTDLETAYRLPSPPKRLSPAATWQERLERWSLVRRTPLFPEHAEVRAGRRGELTTRRWLGQHLKTKSGTIFGGKRVPRDVSAASMGRYEIDLIAVTPRRVVALETKNWSGRLRVEGSRWVHERRDGTVKEFDDLISYNRNKLRALRDYLAHCGVSLPAVRFHHAVIFDNPNLDLDGRLAEHPAVIVGRDVGLLLGRPTGTMTYTLTRVLERCVGNEGARLCAEHLLDVITPRQKQAVCAALAQLRTWDTVTLRGGRILQGDVLCLRIAGQAVSASLLARDSATELRWRRGAWGLCVMLATGAPPGRAVGSGIASAERPEPVALDVDDWLCFHEVGQERPSFIALSSVDHIRIG